MAVEKINCETTFQHRRTSSAKHQCSDKQRRRAYFTLLGLGIFGLLVIITVRVLELNRTKVVNFCPETWMQVKANCYFISVRRSTWAESNKHCSSHGAQLVVIEDEEGLEFLFLQCRRFLTFWIGLNRSPQEEWRWVNNELFNHSRWTLGVSAGGHCACVAQESIESLNCSSQHHWICRMAVANY